MSKTTGRDDRTRSVPSATQGTSRRGFPMDESHDPLRLVKQLHQILAADKLSVGFLLGAGCPCSVRVPNDNGSGTVPLIAGIDGLTATVSEALSNADRMAEPFHRLRDVLNEDGASNPNIEIMLSKIRSLRDAAGTGEVRGLSGESLRELDREICKTIWKTVERTLPGDGTPYHCLADFAGGRRIPPLEVFTTNYDLLVEQALESRRVPFFDGFVGSSRPFFDQQSIEDDALPDRWALLWKLHGSINWRFDRTTNVISRSLDPSDGDELLIHPSHLKYDESRRMPYLVMIDRLKAFLRNERRPVALFVVGHSFSDDHLNATLLEGLSSPWRKCVSLSCQVKWLED
ncbi:MAG: SIR2 family protein, partial [Acidobacteria bacterium]|nr:SIR2 family protein [Acidobacteriota bacterium]